MAAAALREAERRTHVSETTETAGPSREREEPGFAVVAISGRPTVQAFFAEIGRQPTVSVTMLPLDARAVAAAAEAVAAADVAVVDASVDRSDTIAVCDALRT